MLHRINPTETAVWQKLTAHFEATKDEEIKAYFQKNKKRFNQFSLHFEDILLDYSKNKIDKKGLKLLFQLARETKLEDNIKSMFSGEAINETEGRSVLHVALPQPFSPSH